MWKNLLHPSIKRGAWTPREDEALKKLAAAGEERYWDVVADELNKYVMQCLCISGIGMASQLN